MTTSETKGGTGSSGNASPRDAARVTARQTVEAMRLGVVPRGDTRAYTVGREDLMERIGRDLERAEGGGALRALIGAYGSGKTHMLTCIADEARARGFATAQVMLTPTECSPANPQRVHRGLMRSLTLPDREGGPHGLEALLERALQEEGALREHFGVGLLPQSASAEHFLRGDAHLYLTPALQHLQGMQRRVERMRGRAEAHGPEAESWHAREAARTREAREALCGWLSGDSDIFVDALKQQVRAVSDGRGRLYALKDYRPWARIYGYLLSGVASLCMACGYRGLVLLIDEAEFYSLLSSENRGHARTLFQALAYASLGSEAGVELPFDPHESLQGGGMGLLRDLPGTWDEEAPLYTVFAMTPDHGGLSALQGALPEACREELAPLTPEHMEELTMRVRAVYGQAYPDWEGHAAVEALLAKLAAALMRQGRLQTPRECMKFLVDLLDLFRLRRERFREVVRGLAATLEASRSEAGAGDF